MRGSELLMLWLQWSLLFCLVHRSVSISKIADKGNLNRDNTHSSSSGDGNNNLDKDARSRRLGDRQRSTLNHNIDEHFKLRLDHNDANKFIRSMKSMGQEQLHQHQKFALLYHHPQQMQSDLESPSLQLQQKILAAAQRIEPEEKLPEFMKISTKGSTTAQKSRTLNKSNVNVIKRHKSDERSRQLNYYDDEVDADVEGNAEDYLMSANDYGLDLSEYALKYIGCQNVHTWNDQFDGSANNLLNVNRFVIFRLCEADSCSSYNKWGCSNNNYGEYILPMEDYLSIINEYYTNDLGKYCKVCNKCMTYSSNDDEVECVPDDDYYGYGDDYYSNTHDDDSFNENAASAATNDDGSNTDDANSNNNNEAVGYNQYNNWYYNANANNNNNNNNVNNNNYGYYNNYQYNANGYNNYGYNNQYNNGYYGYNNGYNSGYNNGYYGYNGYNNGGGYNNNYYGNRRQLDENVAANDDGNNRNNKCLDGYHAKEKQYPWYIDASTTKCIYSTVCEDYSDVCNAFDATSAANNEDLLTCNGYNIGGNKITYLGPHCNADGHTISIGIYSDNECNHYVGDSSEISSGSSSSGDDIDSSADWTNYHDRSCIPCNWESSFALVTDSNVATEQSVNQLCENLFDTSAKCHKNLATSNGNSISSAEKAVCMYVESLRLNQFDDNGDFTSTKNNYFKISTWTDSQTYIGWVRDVKLYQKIVLIMLIMITLILLIYTWYLKYKLWIRKPWVPPSKVGRGAMSVNSHTTIRTIVPMKSGNNNKKIGGTTKISKKNAIDDDDQTVQSVESVGASVGGASSVGNTNSSNLVSRVNSGIVLVRSDSMGESVGPLGIAAAAATAGTTTISTPYVAYGGAIPPKKNAHGTDQTSGNNQQQTAKTKKNTILTVIESLSPVAPVNDNEFDEMNKNNGTYVSPPLVTVANTPQIVTLAKTLNSGGRDPEPGPDIKPTMSSSKLFSEEPPGTYDDAVSALSISGLHDDASSTATPHQLQPEQ